MGRINYVLLAAVLIAALSPQAAVAAPSHGRGHANGRGVRSDQTVILDRDHQRRVVRDYDRNKTLPPGLAKRESLPPGLAKQLRERDRLPSGLQKRVSSFSAQSIFRIDATADDATAPPKSSHYTRHLGIG